MLKFRECFVKRDVKEVLTPLEDVKKGEVFKLNPASAFDHSCHEGWWVARTDGDKIPPEGNAIIEAETYKVLTQAEGNF